MWLFIALPLPFPQVVTLIRICVKFLVFVMELKKQNGGKFNTKSDFYSANSSLLREMYNNNGNITTMQKSQVLTFEWFKYAGQFPYYQESKKY